MSVCARLAVADWSGVCVPGLDGTHNFPAEVACYGSLHCHVLQHNLDISEDSLSCCFADHRFCPGILHAAV